MREINLPVKPLNLNISNQLETLVECPEGFHVTDMSYGTGSLGSCQWLEGSPLKCRFTRGGGCKAIEAGQFRAITDSGGLRVCRNHQHDTFGVSVRALVD